MAADLSKRWWQGEGFEKKVSFFLRTHGIRRHYTCFKLFFSWPPMGGLEKYPPITINSGAIIMFLLLFLLHIFTYVRETEALNPLLFSIGYGT